MWVIINALLMTVIVVAITYVVSMQIFRKIVESVEEVTKNMDKMKMLMADYVPFDYDVEFVTEDVIVHQDRTQTVKGMIIDKNRRTRVEH